MTSPCSHSQLNSHPVQVSEQLFDVSTDVRTRDVRPQEGVVGIHPDDDEAVRGELGQHVYVHLREDQAVQTPHKEHWRVVASLHWEEHCKSTSSGVAVVVVVVVVVLVVVVVVVAVVV